mmetsp:Transcript_51460/g.124255  ORF Transcript_51460/g.124255 Transcript_51460/m.124255 type:complete len:345 (+) Transcript_51460:140-1174(+)
MGRPTILQLFRQTMGRALRETGQALDRLGIKGTALATTRKTIGDDPVIYQDFLSRHRQFMPLLRRGKPVISNNVAFIAPCATLIGSVYVGPNSSIFYKSILRADSCDNAEAFKKNSGISPDSIESGEEVSALADGWELDPERLEKHKRTTGASVGGGIFVGENTNIQDGCIIDSAKGHTRIGNGVTVGHLASIHSATIEDHCLIGMGSLIGENVLIQEESFIAAGAKIKPNTVVGSGELWVGQPARKLRDLSPEERQRLHYQANEYVGVASGQKDVMLLGGNILPDSLSQYLMPGNDDDHDDIDGVDVDVDDNGEGTDTVIDQEQQNDDDGDGDESNSNKKMAS